MFYCSFFCFFGVCLEFICSGDLVVIIIVLVKIEKFKKKKKWKMNCLFLWWFVYIGWFLCFFMVGIVGFFMLLYGLSFDNK